ncbi:MAG: hypothetical protein EB120_11625 [Proteobacteria bacterium]|nr:hypothetical protein [Pseudomonadota bacterium]
MKLTALEEKVFNYLKEHTTPVQAGTLAKRFIVSDSATAHALRRLVDLGIADAFKVGNKRFFKIR